MRFRPPGNSTRSGWVLAGFLAIAGFFLFTEHKTHLLGALPILPTLAPEADIEQTLRAYPLGIITKQGTLSYHSKAHREVKLPNGRVGWVYDVGSLQQTVPYVSPAGERQSVLETEPRHRPRGYTLVFDNRGVVVDVLYNEDGRHDGLAALSLQHMKGVIRAQEHAHPAGW